MQKIHMNNIAKELETIAEERDIFLGEHIIRGDKCLVYFATKPCIDEIWGSQESQVFVDLFELI